MDVNYLHYHILIAEMFLYSLHDTNISFEKQDFGKLIAIILPKTIAKFLAISSKITLFSDLNCCSNLMYRVEVHFLFYLL